MEDEELKTCGVCNKPRCDEPKACLKQWLEKQFPGEDITQFRINVCRPREEG